MRFFTRNEALVLLAAFAAAQTIFNLFHLAGVDFALNDRASMDSVNRFDVAAGTIVGAAAAWGVFRVMGMRGWVKYWPFVGGTALAVSVIGPLWLAEDAAASVLVLMHVAVAGILTYGLARFGDRCPAPANDTEPASRLGPTAEGNR